MPHPRLLFEIVSTTLTQTEWATLVVVPRPLAPFDGVFWGSDMLDVERIGDHPQGVLYRIDSDSPIVASTPLHVIERYSQPIDEYHPPTTQRIHPNLQKIDKLPNGQIEQIWVVPHAIKQNTQITLQGGTPIEFEISRPYDRLKSQNAVLRTVRAVAIPRGQAWVIPIGD